MRHAVKWIVQITTFGMFLVLLMGVLVTKTGSSRGCGDDWPLCNGKFVPAYTIESMIEYSHRFVTGLLGLFVIASVFVVFRYIRRKDAGIYVLMALFFTLLQAVLGAMAVVWPQSSATLALHFGFSLMAFASTLLLTLATRDWAAGTEGSAKRGFLSFRPADESVKMTPGFIAKVWIVALYCYVVVYVGAFVRHTDSYAGCTGWPLCNGKVIPELAGAAGIAFAHRVAALLLFVSIAWLFFSARKEYGNVPKIRKSAGWVFALVSLQVLSGGFVTYALGSDWYLLASLIHTVLVSCLFGVLTYLCALTFKYRQAEERLETKGLQPSGHKS